jgi:hypothetical protein
MNSPSDPWLAFALVVLFGLLLFLRVKFPNASRGSETTALAVTTLLFFLVCHVFLAPRESPARPADQITPIQAGR